MTQEARSALSRIAEGLNGPGAMNYTASFGVFIAPHPGKPLDVLVRDGLGEEAVIGGSCQSTREEVAQALDDAIGYRGDEGAHPSPAYTSSPAFSQDAHQAKREVALLAEAASTISAFWLKAGHPFYPVFWDFAFVLHRADDAVLLIGSSSD